ncbi:hypothetical protein B0H14DRAFT_760888 [Mycena olivaceomarginata]|nr:hypothetical protein B0H14DRAFT_760888 [Mycena olivaceomarginata]
MSFLCMFPPPIRDISIPSCPLPPPVLCCAAERITLLPRPPSYATTPPAIPVIQSTAPGTRNPLLSPQSARRECGGGYADACRRGVTAGTRARRRAKAGGTAQRGEGGGWKGRTGGRENNGPAISYTCLRRRIIRCGRQSRQSRLGLIDQKTKRACRSVSEQTDQRRRRGGEATEVEKEVMGGSRGGREVEGEERNERGKADKEGRMYQRVSLPFFCPFSIPYVAVASGSPPYTVDCNLPVPRPRPTLLPAQIIIHAEISRSGRIGA